MPGVPLALLGFVTACVAAPAAGADISLQAAGALLGVVGYFLGAYRLAVATIVLCVVAIFFGFTAGRASSPV